MLDDCKPILADCVFESNRVGTSVWEGGAGGGLFARNYSGGFVELSISGCVFLENTATLGGAVWISGNHLSDVRGCVFKANTARGREGGIGFLDAASYSVTLTDSIVCGNQPNQISSRSFVDGGDNCIRNICIDLDGDGVPDCGEVETDLELSVPDEYPTIAHALDAAAPGAVIDVAAGTYRPEAPLATLGTTLLIRRAAAERGGPTTIIDVQREQYPVFFVVGDEGTTTSFENLVITGGSGWRGGGMFDSSEGSLSVANTVFTGNVAAYQGGGLFSSISGVDSTKTLVDCVFEGNHAINGGDGGGLYGSNLTVIDSVITGNTCIGPDDGGGLNISQSSLIGTEVWGNTPDQISGWNNTTAETCVSEICIDCESCGGDFNGDFEVDGADLSILMVAWGECERCSADLNGNGTVDIGDLGLLMAAWGRCGD